MSVRERSNRRPPRVPVLIRKGDMVRIVAGRDRLGFTHRSARVLAVDRRAATVTVEHAQIIKKHTRRNPQKNVAGGVLDKEAPIHVSNVMLVCPACDRPTRIGQSVRQEGDRKVRTRVCKHCAAPLDR
ncbi:MAG TPA: 50S ribosomal protein L24 [Patescibacteria group bacterium]|nr:50S ribosomal protein L24 [Patescibacteria group bacterium]